ncbi:MAG: hypothetical protein WC313_07475 [Candidatus Kapaibacterium sp.]
MRIVSYIIIIMLLSFSVGNAQVKIDIKTKFNSKKKEMQAVKAGVIEMIKTVNWIKVGEIGEKYSFWIKDLEIIPNPKNFQQSVVKFSLSLNTPAMFSEGKVLKTRFVEFVVDKNETLPISNAPELKRALEKFDKKMNMNISNMEWITATVSTGGLAGFGYVAQTMTKVASKFQSGFTPIEETMGLWAGFYSLSSLHDMLTEQGEFQ